MSDDRPPLRAVLRGLVVGDSQNLRAGLSLDQVDRAAQNEAPVDRNRLALAVRVTAGSIRQTEGKPEQPGPPSPAPSEIARPDVQIDTDTPKLVLIQSIHPSAAPPRVAAGDR